jgi:tRNA(Ile)-lysidine synthase
MPRPPAAVARLRAAVAAALADLPATGRAGVACSGGPDSVALADAAVALLGADRVVVLHVDHGLHAGSPAAAEHVRALAGALGCAVEVLAVRVPRGASVEDQARAVRYAALEAAAARHRLACVLAGHTARDQAETVLLRLVRGTGPAGLAGIPARRGVHRRPLLELPRAQVTAYLAARRLPSLADPMNDDPRFARVRVRQRLMPALAAENPRVEEALRRLARAAAEWSELVDAHAARVVAAARRRDGAIAVAVDALGAAGPAAGKRALQRLAAPAALEAEHLDAAWRLVDEPGRGGRGVDVPGARVERAYDDLLITRGAPAARPPLVIEGVDGPYQVRPWRAGDRMRPPRLRGRSRKLSDLYADARIPRRARQGARVVVAPSGEVVWAEHLGAAAGARVHVRVADDG